jgi:hypothetical protein
MVTFFIHHLLYQEESKQQTVRIKHQITAGNLVEGLLKKGRDIFLSEDFADHLADRDELTETLKRLQHVIPGTSDNLTHTELVDETINYIKWLKANAM